MLGIYEVTLKDSGMSYKISEEGVVELFGDKISMHLLNLENVDNVAISDDEVGGIVIRKVN